MGRFFSILHLFPLYAGLAYLTTTILLFIAGPFEWPIKNPAILMLFLSAVLVSMFVGFILGVRSPCPSGFFSSWLICYRLGAIASALLLFPSTWAYTAKWPWDIGLVLGDQGAAYREMLAALDANESGIRQYVAVVRVLFAPLVFCVIPFSILNWERLRRTDVVLLLLHVMSIIVFSLMRGTDRETIDLLLIISGSLFVRLGRFIVRRGRLSFNISRAAIFLFCFGVLLVSALALFVDRKESRMGGDEAFCIGENVVCSSRSVNQTPVVAKFMFGLEMLSAYMSQGYYGLSLALDEDFSWTYGVGHSSFLMGSLVREIDGSLYERSYMAKISAAGWDDKEQWSTIFPWLASDVGFAGVPFVMAMFAFVWGFSWRSSVLFGSDLGALVFLFSCILVLYIPANNQLAQTLDSYFSAIFWFFIWLAGGGFAVPAGSAGHQHGKN